MKLAGNDTKITKPIQEHTSFDVLIMHFRPFFSYYFPLNMYSTALLHRKITSESYMSIGYNYQHFSSVWVMNPINPHCGMDNEKTSDHAH